MERIEGFDMNGVLDVKVGDKIIYYYGHGRRKVTEVIKVTPTGRLRVKANPSLQFNKYGSLMGEDCWYHAYIIKATDELIEQTSKDYTIRKAMCRMHVYNEQDLSYEQAVKILEILGE